MSRRAPLIREGARLRGRLVWLLLVCFCTSARAEPAKEISALRSGDSLRLVRDHFRARGAGNVRELGKELVFEGQGVVRSLTLATHGCIGVLAWGGEGVRDVDVGIYSRSGQMLAEDRGATPFGYARLCGAA